jgi:hypothetical protein
LARFTGKIGCAYGSSRPCRERGRVREFVRVTGAWRLQKTPHLSPLPLPKERGGVLASFSKLTINAH